VILIQSTNVTDRQTDGRHRKTALCTVAHRGGKRVAIFILAMSNKLMMNYFWSYFANFPNNSSVAKLAFRKLQ